MKIQTPAQMAAMLQLMADPPRNPMPGRMLEGGGPTRSRGSGGLAQQQENAYQAGYAAYDNGIPQKAAPQGYLGKHWLGGWLDRHNEMTGVPPED